MVASSATTWPLIASGIATTPQGSAITAQKIGDDAAGIVDIAAKVIMLNSVLNGDWSNSVPGRQFPKGD